MSDKKIDRIVHTINGQRFSYPFKIVPDNGKTISLHHYKDGYGNWKPVTE